MHRDSTSSTTEVLSLRPSKGDLRCSVIIHVRYNCPTACYGPFSTKAGAKEYRREFWHGRPVVGETDIVEVKPATKQTDEVVHRDSAGFTWTR